MLLFSHENYTICTRYTCSFVHYTPIMLRYPGSGSMLSPFFLLLVHRPNIYCLLQFCYLCETWVRLVMGFCALSCVGGRGELLINLTTSTLYCMKRTQGFWFWFWFWLILRRAPYRASYCGVDFFTCDGYAWDPYFVFPPKHRAALIFLLRTVIFWADQVTSP